METNVKDYVSKDKLIIYLIAALLATFAGVLKDFFNPPRPDPFTGTEGRALEQRIEKLETGVTGLPPQWVLDSVNRNTEHLEKIEENYNELYRYMIRKHPEWERRNQ